MRGLLHGGLSLLLFTRAIGSDDGRKILEGTNCLVSLVGLEILKLYVFQATRHIFLVTKFHAKSQEISFRSENCTFSCDNMVFCQNWVIFVIAAGNKRERSTHA